MAVYCITSLCHTGVDTLLPNVVRFAKTGSCSKRLSTTWFTGGSALWLWVQDDIAPPMLKIPLIPSRLVCIFLFLNFSFNMTLKSHLAVVKSLDWDWDQFQKLISSKLGGKKHLCLYFLSNTPKTFWVILQQEDKLNLPFGANDWG